MLCLTTGTFGTFLFVPLFIQGLLNPLLAATTRTV
jgi:hypothetical protein